MAPRRRRRIGCSTPASDVTVYDYADATKPRRLRKCNTINVEHEKIPVLEHEVLFIDSRDQDMQQHKKSIRLDNSACIEFPEILFHLLSGYIFPEDVGRFAGINRAAAAATRRAGFWRGLYARHCGRDDHALPSRLKLDDHTTYGIRQRVVCALYRLYPPFLHAESERRRRGAAVAVLSRLVGLRCVDVWYEKDTSSVRWKYYVKLKPKIPSSPTSDVLANPEEDSIILIAVNEERVALPAAMGLLVSGAGAPLGGAALDTRRLRLDLTRARHLAAPVRPDCSLVLHGVHELETVRWWQPRFPAFAVTRPQIHFDPELPILDTDFLMMP